MVLWFAIPKSPINNNPALYQIMARCWRGDKPVIWTNDGQVYWYMYASLNLSKLTQWESNKISAILLDNIFKCIFVNENIFVLTQI